MIKLDKIKIVSSIKNISNINEDKFQSTVKEGEIVEQKYFIQSPFNLYIEADYKDKELVIECTGKILKDDYPNLINKEHIRMDRSENNMGITGVNRETYHSYMVAYIYGKFQFGSLIIKEEFDTNTASAEDIANWVDVSMTTYPIYSCDGTVLKMLARGNPAVVYAKDGVIEWKRTLQSIDAARVEEALNGGGGFAWIASDYNGAMRLNVLTVGYIILLVMILILNRSYRVFKFSSRLIDKNKNKNVTLQNEK